MTLHTATQGVGEALTETLFDMQHLVFCLLVGLVLFTLRRKPRDAWYYILALFPGYALERLYPLQPFVVNVVVALTVVFALLLEWIYEKLAAYTIPILLLSGFFHGLSLSQAVSGSATPAFLAYALTATLVQALLMNGFGRLCSRIAMKSPDAFEGLDNILSAVGTGVALAYFFWAF
ncbi:MAG TPA: hypothetical protein VE954_03570 [Oligoflexus sp.]|uniref:hypothetical protein n=1 Tax=Oligoflexus sp. TaxID=1971216 RepID=UPI002D518A21|nr:hypothetical protein [Oligoflexus sp.]HYX32166.1 hypothetical protein [Oligoflexus sp.]